MPGRFRHISVVFWLCSAPLLTLGQARGFSPDSLFIEGRIATPTDSILTETALQVKLGDFTLTAGDSVGVAVHRGTSLTGWARGFQGRLQFEVPWPKYADTCRLWLGCDTLGLTAVCATDTMHWSWTSEYTGCFPVTTSRAVAQVLARAQRLPFESSRLSLIVDWLGGKCVNASQIERLASAFDDEARRLQIIQSATPVSPSEVHRLTGLFASQHYRSVFIQWASTSH